MLILFMIKIFIFLTMFVHYIIYFFLNLRLTVIFSNLLHLFVRCTINLNIHLGLIYSNRIKRKLLTSCISFLWVKLYFGFFPITIAYAMDDFNIYDYFNQDYERDDYTLEAITRNIPATPGNNLPIPGNNPPPPVESEEGSNFPYSGMPPRITRREQNLDAEGSAAPAAPANNDNQDPGEVASSSRAIPKGRRKKTGYPKYPEGDVFQRYNKANAEERKIQHWLEHEATPEQRQAYEEDLRIRNSEIQRKDEADRDKKREYDAERYLKRKSKAKQ